MFKIIIMTFVALILFVSGLAAQHSLCDSLYTVIDEMPTFGNKQGDFSDYLRSNLKFKKNCDLDKLRQIAWTINKEGKMVDIEVTGIEGECEGDVIEQIKRFPRWIPGK